MQTEDTTEIFTLPLPEQAMDELMSMQHDIQYVNYDEGSNDVWSFLWGNSQYTSSKFYKLAFKHLQVPKTFKWVWKSKCTPRLKIFAWFILMDPLNTRDMLRRRNFHVQPNTFCVHCNDQVVEDVNHLFFKFPFSTVCWQKLVHMGHQSGYS